MKCARLVAEWTGLVYISYLRLADIWMGWHLMTGDTTRELTPARWLTWKEILLQPSLEWQHWRNHSWKKTRIITLLSDILEGLKMSVKLSAQVREQIRKGRKRGLLIRKKMHVVFSKLKSEVLYVMQDLGSDEPFQVNGDTQNWVKYGNKSL